MPVKKLYTSFSTVVTVHRYPVNVTAYAHLRLPAAMGHMLWPHYDTGSRSMNGVTDRSVDAANCYKNARVREIKVVFLQILWYDNCGL